MNALLEERSRRQQNKSVPAPRAPNGNHDNGERSLESLVESVKRKTSTKELRRSGKRQKTGP